MATIPELLTKFLIEAPLNISEIERLSGVADNTLRKVKTLERNIPEKHFFKVLEVCVNYGFKISPKTRLEVDVETHTVILITDTEIVERFEVDEQGKEYRLPDTEAEMYEYESPVIGASHFLYKQHQYKTVLDEFEIFNHNV